MNEEIARSEETKIISRNLDVISFLIGGVVFGIGAASITVYLGYQGDSIEKIATAVIGVYLALIIVILIYWAYRRKLLKKLFGVEISGIRETIDQCVSTLVSSKGRESYDQRLVAARKVTAIYADYQTRKLIVTTVLIVFGATTALLSAAFLVRQTKAMESQLLKLDIQNGSIETQTTAISTQTDLLKLQLENQEKTNAITIELSELESRYKPFWILYNSNSKELRNESFVTLLEDKLLNREFNL